MISDKMQQLLNDQFIHELYSTNLYLSMASYFQMNELDGFAHFFKIQAREEYDHAMKYFDFVHDVGGKILVTSVAAPQTEFQNPLQVIEIAMEHEKSVTKKINDLVDAARDMKEHATFAFLQWFVTEQVEEEAQFNKILKSLETIHENRSILYILDGRLAQRGKV